MDDGDLQYAAICADYAAIWELRRRSLIVTVG
jgi:hypothetical protein